MGRGRGRTWARWAAAGGLVLAAVLAPVGAASAAPPGFTDTLVAPVPAPTALAFLPDGRALVASQPGQLRLLRADGTLVATPALDLSSRACSNFGERGLLGVTVGSGFADTGFVYVYWTRRTGPDCPRLVRDGLPENRVSRFTLGRGGTVVPGSELVLVDHLPSFGGNHNGGDLRFGADGLLYITVGDAGCQLTDATQCAGANANARRLDIPLGKVLRVTRTGAVPASNPYVGRPGARRCTGPTVPPGAGPCTETFASGFRNPFRFALRPGTSEFFVNDVGQDDREEVDRLARGADYGWNRCEGTVVQGTATPCDLAGATAPLLDYTHATGCASITGGAFVPGAVFGAGHRGSYLYADFVCGKVFERRPDGTTSTFLDDLGGGSATALAFGPYRRTQALYYLSYADGGGVHRVARAA